MRSKEMWYFNAYSVLESFIAKAAQIILQQGF